MNCTKRKNAWNESSTRRVSRKTRNTPHTEVQALPVAACIHCTLPAIGNAEPLDLDSQTVSTIEHTLIPCTEVDRVTSHEIFHVNSAISVSDNLSWWRSNSEVKIAEKKCLLTDCFTRQTAVTHVPLIILYYHNFTIIEKRVRWPKTSKARERNYILQNNFTWKRCKTIFSSIQLKQKR